MDKLLEQDPGLFKIYAIRDAEIAAQHLRYMISFAGDNGLGEGVPTTIGGLAVRHLQNIWAENSIVAGDVLGTEVVREQVWDARNQRYLNRRRTVPIPTAHENATLAIESYHGGRNEAFTFGFTDLDFWFDYDLSAAYTTGLSAIRMPDWRAMVHDLDPTHYTADRLGLARVRFKFLENTRFPTLPLRSDHGLIFPLKGETHVGSPEIQLALELDAEIEILNGWIVPWASDVRPFEAFSRNVRQHRSNLPKGSVDERTWKEIGNSVYGKLAQGLREKRVYDSRCQRRSKSTPLAGVKIHHLMRFSPALAVVPVVHRRDPRCFV